MAGSRPKSAEKWPSKWPDMQKFGDFLRIGPFARPFWDPPLPGAAGHFAGHFSAIFHFPFCNRSAKLQNLVSPKLASLSGSRPFLAPFS